MKSRLKGKVYLVGSGPGDPDLLTIKATKVLKRADIILYDRLVGKQVLKHFPRKARRVYVGERHGYAAERQERIYTLIKKYTSDGLTIVRLQNGDPLLFARGGEEIQFLRREKIPYEVVPGITSAIGVPSAIGFPLTERTTSSAVLIVPGHSMDGNLLDWKELASFQGTIVILMGASHIEQICGALISNGKDPTTPACAIERGTLSKQRITTAKLEDLGRKARARHVSAPALLVIGNAVRLLESYRE